MTDPLEIAATLFTLVCVVLAVKRNLWQFPTGIIGTALGFFVFWNTQLYSSAALQPVFIAVQVDTFSDANMALPDASIFALSIVAQILLSRKRIENWPVWIVINAISVYVYASQTLWLYTGLYAFFFFNAFWGWWEWRKEMRGYFGAEERSAP